MSAWTCAYGSKEFDWTGVGPAGSLRSVDLAAGSDVTPFNTAYPYYHKCHPNSPTDFLFSCCSVDKPMRKKSSLLFHFHVTHEQ